MFENLQASMLRLLRVPAQPEPPFGKPASVRIFRASRKFYYLRLVKWGFTQAAALAGIIFWFGVISVSEHEAARMRSNPDDGNLSSLRPGRNRVALGSLRNIPSKLFTWLLLLKFVGVAVYAGQLFITFIALRMDYQLRWYIVTDRSLRIRFGVWNVQEVTMSYANLQQVMVSQGPLERLLGISNVRVESAGGGKGSDTHEHKSDSMHCGVFHGVENAGEIRDLILDRLRSFRETGLGDPDEHRHTPTDPHPAQASPTPVPAHLGEAVLAARELLAETRALRLALAQDKTQSL